MSLIMFSAVLFLRCWIFIFSLLQRMQLKLGTAVTGDLATEMKAGAVFKSNLVDFWSSNYG